MASLYKKFKEKIRYELKDKLGKKNIHEVPQVDKVIVAMGIGNLATKKGMKDFSELESNLTKITGQKPVIVKAKKSVSNFKLREGMPVMLKVTLRREKAYDFLERLNTYVFERVRDFKGIPERKIDAQGNLSFGFKDQTVFAELTPDEITIPQGVQVTISTTSDSKEDTKALLESLGFLFTK
jgi:large subunit ribosomal protein L5